MTYKNRTKKEQMHVPAEFGHVLKVLEMGAKKYGANSWLYGRHFDIHANHKSMSHHLLESYREVRKDHESGLDPLLHLATRALMEYTLRAREKIAKDGTVINWTEEVFYGAEGSDVRSNEKMQLVSIGMTEAKQGLGKSLSLELEDDSLWLNPSVKREPNALTRQTLEDSNKGLNLSSNVSVRALFDEVEQEIRQELDYGSDA